MPDEEMTIQKENVLLKRDLEFATSEIERLRAKLVVDDNELTPLAEELYGGNPIKCNSL